MQDLIIASFLNEISVDCRHGCTRLLHKTIPCAADWVTLDALFGPSECFYCDIPNGCRHLRVDKNGNRWKMEKPAEIPKGALLPIFRNIRICGFHSFKRICSTLCDLLLISKIIDRTNPHRCLNVGKMNYALSGIFLVIK
jgi:hypothetical protein